MMNRPACRWSVARYRICSVHTLLLFRVKVISHSPSVSCLLIAQPLYPVGAYHARPRPHHTTGRTWVQGAGSGFPLDMSGPAGYVVVAFGWAGHGMARLGSAWRGKAKQARQSRQGKAGKEERK